MTRLKRLGGWDFDEGCRCDADFIDYCAAQGFVSKVIFHLGCGLHHRVGRELSREGRENQVLSVTASREELLSYADAVLEDPGLARRYRVLFSDVYDLEERLLPRFDAVTLFHLCEPPDADRPDLILATRSLLGAFLKRLHPGGRLFFYRDSTGYGTLRAVIMTVETQGLLVTAGEHGSLLIYRAAER